MVLLYPFVLYYFWISSSLCVLLCPAASGVQSHHPGGPGELSLFIEVMTFVDYHWKRQEPETPSHLDSNRSSCDMQPTLQNNSGGSGWNHSPTPQVSAWNCILLGFLLSIFFFYYYFLLYLNQSLFMKPHLEIIFWGARSETGKAEMKGDKLGKNMWFPSMLVF